MQCACGDVMQQSGDQVTCVFRDLFLGHISKAVTSSRQFSYEECIETEAQKNTGGRSVKILHVK
jgi:hypothetical protein